MADLERQPGRRSRHDSSISPAAWCWRLDQKSRRRQDYQSLRPLLAAGWAARWSPRWPTTGRASWRSRWRFPREVEGLHGLELLPPADVDASLLTALVRCGESQRSARLGQTAPSHCGGAGARGGGCACSWLARRCQERPSAALDGTDATVRGRSTGRSLSCRCWPHCWMWRRCICLLR